MGYLAYDDENETCSIPNWEVRKEWYYAIEAEPEYAETKRIIMSSKELREETIAGNEEAVAKALDKTHTCSIERFEK